jgi:hypothetical protein
MKKKHRHHRSQATAGPFAGLRGERGGDAAQALRVVGRGVEPIDDPRAAAWASGPESLVPCAGYGDGPAVDRFDGVLLLGDAARRERPRGRGAAAGADADAGGGGEADAVELDAERYRDLDPSREHLLLSGLTASDGADRAANARGARRRATPSPRPADPYTPPPGPPALACAPSPCADA